MSKRTTLAVAAALVLGAGGGTADAALTWLPSEELRDKSVFGAKWLALDPGGNAVAVWMEFPGTGSYVTRARTRSAGHAWAPVKDAADGYPSGLAVGGNGRAFVIVQDGILVRVVTRARNGPWSGPKTLSTSGGLGTIAAGPNGQAVAAWLEGTGEVKASVRRAGGWSAARPVATTASGFQPFGLMGAVDKRGRAFLIWREAKLDPIDCFPEPICWTFGRVRVAVRPPAGTNWRVATVASPSPETSSFSPGAPRLGLDGSGNLLAGWHTPVGYFETRRRSSAGVWGPARSIGGLPTSPPPELRVAPSGRATLLWFAGQNVFAATKSPGGSAPWSAPSPIQGALPPSCSLPCGAVTGLAIANGRAGDAVAAWISRDATDYSVRARVRRGGSWRSVRSASPSGVFPTTPLIAVDGAGNALAGWTRTASPGYAFEVAGLDAAGPVPRGLDVPRRARIGQKIRFAVNPFDVWSALAGKPAWRFGDGGTASGKTVRHAYRTPGRETVTLTLRDARGNTTIIKRTIQIRP